MKDLRELIGQMVRVRDNENSEWEQSELIAVLPSDILYRYVVIDMLKKYSVKRRFCEPIPKKKVTERRWRMLKEFNTDGVTNISGRYYNQYHIDEDWSDWYKHPTDYLDIIVEDV